jgi:membrane associated rhomboid family serine protease
MFLHANWLHLIGNVWYLWVFGDKLIMQFCTDPNSGVAWVAHVTGFVVGVVVTLVVKPHLASTRRLATWGPG